MKLHQLLGTKNTSEQEQRVQELLTLINNPPITLVITVDPVRKSISVVPTIGQMDAQQAVQILTTARDYLIGEIAKAKQKEGSNENTDGRSERLASDPAGLQPAAE